LGDEGIVGRILAFNVGVELGQVAALTVMLAFFAVLRSSKSFERFGKVSNIALVLAGVGLFFFQMNGYAQGEHPHVEHAAEVEGHAAEAEAHAHGEEGHAHGEEAHGEGHRH
jgi:hypothetical protein